MRAGVYVGDYSARVREKLWKVVCSEAGTGNAVLAWNANCESGFEFVTTGPHARQPVDWDGLQLVAYHPEDLSAELEKGD